MESRSDRNLLFGVLALQLDYVTQAQLVAAANAWMVSKGSTLGELLERDGVISVEDRRLLDRVVDRHLDRGGSAERELEKLKGDASGSQIADAVASLFTELGVGADKSGEEHDAVDADGPVTKLHEGSQDAMATMGWSVDDDVEFGKRYRVLRHLADGGLGRVNVALDSELEREVAIKEILKRQVGSAEARERFVAEAKITGRLEHPGIVPIYGLGRTGNGMPYYAMRLIRGQSMRQELANAWKAAKRFKDLDNETLRRILRALIDASNAVGYAHSRGVVHRDLKPANIMQGKFGETLVVDWGLAKVLGSPTSDLALSEPVIKDSRSGDSSRTMMGAVIGTVGYASPEQAAGRIDLLDHRSDVFGLGGCLYTILTHRIPYSGSARGDVIAAARNRELDLPQSVDPSIPRELAAVCLKAMARDPSQRYESAVEFAGDLERWLADEPVSVVPDPLSKKVWRWARKHQSLVVGALVALVLAIAGLAAANQAISHQRDLADDARETAVKAEERAVQSREVAFGVLDEFVKRLADDAWSQIPGLENQRLEMVDLASQRYGELVRQYPDDYEMRRQLLSLQFRTANIYRLLGNTARAEEEMSVALETVEKLLNGSVALSDGLLSSVADATNSHTQLMLATRGPATAEPINQRELQLRRILLDADPNSQVKQFGLARALIVKAEIVMHLNQITAAQESLIEADRHLAHVVSSEANAGTLFLVADILRFHLQSLRGQIFIHERKFVEAEKVLQTAMSLAEAAMEKHGPVADLRNFYAKVWLERLRLAIAKGDVEDADMAFAQADGEYQILMEGFSTLHTYPDDRIELRLLSAIALGGQGDWEAAQQLLGEAEAWLPKSAKKGSDAVEAFGVAKIRARYAVINAWVQREGHFGQDESAKQLFQLLRQREPYHLQLQDLDGILQE